MSCWTHYQLSHSEKKSQSALPAIVSTMLLPTIVGTGNSGRCLETESIRTYPTGSTLRPVTLHLLLLSCRSGRRGHRHRRRHHRHRYTNRQMTVLSLLYLRPDRNLSRRTSRLTNKRVSIRLLRPCSQVCQNDHSSAQEIENCTRPVSYTHLTLPTKRIV